MNSYTYTADSDDESYTPEIIDMSVGINNIYALFSKPDDMPELIAFDGQLKEDVEGITRGTLSTDAFMMTFMSSNRLALASSEGISVVRRNTISKIWSSDKTVKAMCRDDNDGLYFVAHNESEDADELYHYDESKVVLMPIDSFDVAPKYQLVRDIDNHILAVMTGDSILLYSTTDDLLVEEFDASYTEGSFVSIAASTTDAEEGSSSGSNCNVSCLGAIMMSVCLYAVLRRKR